VGETITGGDSGATATADAINVVDDTPTKKRVWAITSSEAIKVQGGSGFYAIQETTAGGLVETTVETFLKNEPTGSLVNLIPFSIATDGGTPNIYTVTPDESDIAIELSPETHTDVTYYQVACYSDYQGAQPLFAPSSSREKMGFTTLSAVSSRINYGGAASVTAGSEFGDVLSDGTSNGVSRWTECPPDGAVNIAAGSALELTGYIYLSRN
jgi:hypothetical protein